MSKPYRESQAWSRRPDLTLKTESDLFGLIKLCEPDSLCHEKEKEREKERKKERKKERRKERFFFKKLREKIIY